MSSCSEFLQQAMPAGYALLGVVIGSLLTHFFNRKRDHLELKRDVLRRAMGYRWQLTSRIQRPDSHFFTAINEVLVVFAGDNDVERAFKKYLPSKRGRYRAVAVGNALPRPPPAQIRACTLMHTAPTSGV